MDGRGELVCWSELTGGSLSMQQGGCAALVLWGVGGLAREDEQRAFMKD